MIIRQMIAKIFEYFVMFIRIFRQTTCIYSHLCFRILNIPQVQPHTVKAFIDLF